MDGLSGSGRQGSAGDCGGANHGWLLTGAWTARRCSIDLDMIWMQAETFSNVSECVDTATIRKTLVLRIVKNELTTMYCIRLLLTILNIEKCIKHV